LRGVRGFIYRGFRDVDWTIQDCERIHVNCKPLETYYDIDQCTETERKGKKVRAAEKQIGQFVAFGM